MIGASLSEPYLVKSTAALSVYMMMVRTPCRKSVHPLLTRQYLNFSLTRLVRICTFIQYVYSKQDAFSTIFARVMDAQQKREARLSRRRERERRNRASESTEQRQVRLARRRVRDRARRVAQSAARNSFATEKGASHQRDN